jgi:hypothetical protein
MATQSTLLGSGLDDADGETAQGSEVLGAVPGTDGAAILVPVPVEAVVAAVFDGPVTAVVGQHAGGAGGLRGVAGESEDGFGGGLAGLLPGHLTLDGEDLSDAGEVEIVVEAGGGPDGTLFDAAVGQVG